MHLERQIEAGRVKFTDWGFLWVDMHLEILALSSYRMGRRDSYCLLAPVQASTAEVQRLQSEQKVLEDEWVVVACRDSDGASCMCRCKRNPRPPS